MKSIAVIDSGSGGLTVAQKIFEQLPDEHVIYVGDHGNCPYGSKSDVEIKELVYNIVHFLSQFDLKMLVVACNTATAVMIEELQEKMDFPVVGVIEPGAKMAVNGTSDGVIGVIATEKTVQSNMYRKVINDLLPTSSVYEQACPKLVPYLEGGEGTSEDVNLLLEEYLFPLKSLSVDTLVLGCTHYPLLEQEIVRVIGDKVKIINPACETVNKIKEISLREEVFEEQRYDSHLFFTTGDIESFRSKVRKWTTVKNPTVNKVENEVLIFPQN